MIRRGLGIGLGKGYYNLVPRDPYIHSLSAKGVKTKRRYYRWDDGKLRLKKPPLEEPDTYLPTDKELLLNAKDSKDKIRETFFNIVNSMTDKEWWEWVSSWYDPELIVETYENWDTYLKEQELSNLKKRYKKLKTTKTLNEALDKLTDKEWWEWVSSWYDPELIVETYENWDDDLLKEELKNIKNNKKVKIK